MAARRAKNRQLHPRQTADERLTLLLPAKSDKGAAPAAATAILRSVGHNRLYSRLVHCD
jgi:hypothetical protein